MLLRLIEEKRPIDLILFCDTGLEFPQMYDHLKKLEQHIGRKITYLKAEHGFEYYFFDYMPKRKNPKLEQYSGMSWAGPYNRWCTAMLKTRIIAKYLKDLKKTHEIVEYIGIAADEPKRIKGSCYPLVEWGMTEKDCLAYCYERGFHWGGLYEIFHRGPVGVVPCRLFRSFASFTSIFPIYGSDCADGMTALGESSERTIPCVSWKSALHLKRNGASTEKASEVKRSIMR